MSTEAPTRWLYHPKGTGYHLQETQLVQVLGWTDRGAIVLGEEPGTLSMFAPEFVRIGDLTKVPEDREPAGVPA